MPTTIISNLTINVVSDDPQNEPVVLLYTLSADDNEWPRNLKWRLQMAGHLEAVIQDVAATCSEIENGNARWVPSESIRDDRESGAIEYAQLFLEMIRHPAPSARLEPKIKIDLPNFDLHYLFRGQFESPKQAKKEFESALKKNGVKVGQEIDPEKHLSLLLDLNRFSSQCHAAWPRSPVKPTNNSVLLRIPMPDQFADCDLQSESARFLRIRDTKLVIDQKQAQIITMTQARQRFWLGTFPKIATSESIEEAYQCTVDAIDGIEKTIDSDQIEIAPGDQLTTSDRMSWKEVFQDAESGSLHDVIQHFGDHDLGVMLLNGCKIKAIHADKPEDRMIASPRCV